MSFEISTCGDATELVLEEMEFSKEDKIAIPILARSPVNGSIYRPTRSLTSSRRTEIALELLERILRWLFATLGVVTHRDRYRSHPLPYLRLLPPSRPGRRQLGNLVDIPGGLDAAPIGEADTTHPKCYRAGVLALGLPLIARDRQLFARVRLKVAVVRDDADVIGIHELVRDVRIVRVVLCSCLDPDVDLPQRSSSSTIDSNACLWLTERTPGSGSRSSGSVRS